MALSRGKLADPQYIDDTVGAIYTNPATTKTYIRSIVIFNGGGSDETVEVHNVPDAAGSVGTPDGSNKFATPVVPAGDTVFLDFQYPITLTDENDTIQAVTDTASTVTVQILGDKE